VNFYAKLKKSGVPADFITIEGGGHGMNGWNKLNSDYIAQFLNWLNKTLKT
jgi:dipeptidyl aminopeptidase/acylaminoacyl peptidase